MNQSRPPIIEVTTTCNSQEAAQQLSEKLVAARLAACVQVSGPITSVYHWKGAIESDQEWTCTIKSLATLQDRLVEFIEANHSYQVPQILIASVEASDKYAQWVAESLK